VASSVGGLKDVVEEDKTGWLVPANDAAALARRITQLRREECLAMQPAISEFCQDNSWQRMADVVRQLAD